MNRKMAEEIAGISLVDADNRDRSLLSDSLWKIADSGWSVESQGAHVLSALRGKGHPPVTFFPNLTFYEAAVNHVHIPDDGSAGHEEGAEKNRLIVGAILFARHILRSASDTSTDMMAVVAAGRDEDGATVRAYCKRPGEFWVDEDLEKYTDEAIMTLDTSDVS
jgi:hypothetical protein